MERLKVYLTKNEDNRKADIKRIKQRMLHSKSYVHEHPRITHNRSTHKHCSSPDKKSKSNKNKGESLCRQFSLYNKLEPTHKKSRNQGNKKSHSSYSRMHLSDNNAFEPQKCNTFKPNSNINRFIVNESNKHVKPLSSKKFTDQLPNNKTTRNNSSLLEQLKIKKVKTPLLTSSKHYRSFNQIMSSQIHSSYAPRSSKRDKNHSQPTKKGPNKKRSKSASVKNISEQSSMYMKKDMAKIMNLQKDMLKFVATFRTRKGIQIMNPNKVNQDRFLIIQDVVINLSEDRHFRYDFYAVADGHGPCGHHVSNFIVQQLGPKIQFYLTQNFAKYLDKDFKKNYNKQKLEDSIIAKSFHKVYSDLQYMLEKNPEFNAEFSGSTLVSTLVDRGVRPSLNKKIRVTCANVGDSRAIVIRQITRQNWEIIRLSDDHKPSRESEKKRILECGGRVEKIKDEDGNSLGPFRVWLPKKKIQGLAMSRSLGDNISKPIGVSYEPEILSHQLDSRDKIILLASDGVWQFISNYKILTLLIPFYKQNKLEEACQALLKMAHNSWTVEQNTVVDDITFILIFISEGESQIKQFEISVQRKKCSYMVLKSEQNQEQMRVWGEQEKRNIGDLSQIQVVTEPQ